MSFARFGVIALAASIHCALPAGATQVPQAAQQYAGTIVPRVIGQTREGAEEILTKAGLKVVRVQEEPTSQGKPGTVIKQDPPPETPVPRNSEVVLTIAAAADTIVPHLIGLPLNQAMGLLERHRLRGRPGRAAAADKLGLVVEQDPKPDVRVAIGSEVRFWYGVEPPSTIPDQPPPAVRVVQVPDLHQRTLGEARQKLWEAGLELSASDPTGSGDDGIVVKQSPGPGRVVPESTRVQVATIAPFVIVPNVVGLLQRAAEESLGRVELTPQVRRERSQRASGTVLTQHPEAGTRSARRTGVVIVVATPELRPPIEPQPTTEPDSSVPGLPSTEDPVPRPVDTVPDVVGLTREAAREAFRRVGVPVDSIVTAEQDGAAGRVSAQQPLARTAVQPGVRGWLTVTVPVRLVDVPDLVGMDVADATRVLDSVRLARGTVKPVERPGRPNVVIAQDPHAGGEVRPLTPVELTATTPSTLVPVPLVLGLTRAEAVRSLRRAQLVPGTISPPSSPVDATVAEQTPAANSMVPRGSRVRLALGVRSPTPPPPPPPAQLVPVPSVVDLFPGDAERLLASAPLGMVRRDTVLGFGADSVVIVQQPAAGDSVPPNSEVQILVGRARPIPWLLIGVAGVGGLGALGGMLRWRARTRLTPEPEESSEPEPTPPIIEFEPHPGAWKPQISSSSEPVTGNELQIDPRIVVVSGQVDGDEAFFQELA